MEFGAPSLGSCVPSTAELYLPCYLTPLFAYLCSNSIRDLVGYKRHTLLGLKSRPIIKQRRMHIIMFREIVGSKKTHNVRP